MTGDKLHKGDKSKSKLLLMLNWVMGGLNIPGKHLGRDFWAEIKEIRLNWKIF